MLVLPIPLAEIKNLAAGVICRINGEEVIVTKDENYICYGENRCQIVQESMDGDLLTLFCASQDQDADQCEVIDHAPTFPIVIGAKECALAADAFVDLVEHLLKSDQVSLNECGERLAAKTSDVLRTSDGKVIHKKSFLEALDKMHSLTGQGDGRPQNPIRKTDSMKTKFVKDVIADQDYYWIAVNRSSAAMSSIPVQLAKLTVSPIPERLIGLPTLKEAAEVRQACLNDPIKEVEKLMEQLLQRADVAKAEMANPEPPTHGPTSWLLGSTDI